MILKGLTSSLVLRIQHKTSNQKVVSEMPNLSGPKPAMVLGTLSDNIKNKKSHKNKKEHKKSLLLEKYRFFMNQTLHVMLLKRCLLLVSLNQFHRGFLNCNCKNIVNSHFKMEESSLIAEGISLTNLEKIVIGVLWFLIEVIGSLLLLGLIQYERLGGDPLKRRIIDQVVFLSD